MPDETVSIARVPLARSARRLLAAPLIAILLGAAAVAVALVLGEWAGVGLGLAGIATVVLATWLALILVTLRLDVEVAAIRLHWLGGERRFTLVRGPVTRVALQGPSAVSLRVRFGAFGWTLGRARLRGEERIEIIRLAPSETLILVPSEGIRLAIVPRSEVELIAALSAAARVQQRLEATRAHLRVPVATAAVARVAPLTLPPEPAAPLPPRVLTGIERVELEERLAAQRAVALAAAEAERRAEQAARAAAPSALSASEALSWPARNWPRLAWARPAWTRLPQASVASIGLLLVPLAGAAAAWLIAVVGGQAHGDSARNLVLAVVLTGPAGTLGAIGARVWWPRLVPLVVAAAVLALVVVGRALTA